MVESICENCGTDVRRFKFLKRVNNKFLCSKCYRENRLRHRKETIETSLDKDKIIELEKRRKKESSLKTYINKNGCLPRTYYPKKKLDIESIPKLKGSQEKKSNYKNYSYLSLEEKQSLFKMLLKRGFSEDECKKRIQDLLKEQKKVREYLKFKNRPESEIKKMQLKLMEGLLR